MYEQDVEDRTAWQGVVITGERYEIEDQDREQACASLAANAECPAGFGVWRVPCDAVGFQPFGRNTKNCTRWGNYSEIRRVRRGDSHSLTLPSACGRRADANAALASDPSLLGQVPFHRCDVLGGGIAVFIFRLLE